MEPNLTQGSKTEKASIYGRDYYTDMELFFNDITLRQTLAVFSHIECIQNPKQLSDILGFDEKASSSKLEALRNIGLLSYSEKGYIENKKGGYYIQEQYKDEDKRASQHAIKLAQIAAQITKGPKFTDHCGIIATSHEIIKKYNDTILSAYKELKTETSKLDANEKKQLFTYATAFFAKELSEKNEDN